ncbi:aminodeoxychorismate synthase component I [Rhizobacter sp. Root1221]|uniref:aminodeoxychorismate synthase component I n=1 Tax=Rhizobacter sp. Root1221 TaxID=1736433 RepID=UPI000AEF6C54|nr:aminodeoxychorismate synthase component I [Rhizobacter sp. Root1221]
MPKLTPRIVPLDLSASPQAVCARLRGRGDTVLLESSKAMPGLSGWSCVAGPPVATLEAGEHETVLRRADGTVVNRWTDPFHALRDVLAGIAHTGPLPHGVPFAGGLAGFVGYDLARHVERLPVIAAADPALPRLRLHLCDHVLAYDHAAARWWSCTTGGHGPRRAAVWAETLARARGPDPAPGSFGAAPLVSRTGPDRYLADVQRVLDYIAAGDIFQANLSHRLEGAFTGDPWALYTRLTALNPAPFSAYLEGGGLAIASVSPERFLKLDGRDVVARPIKGTRARDADPALDGEQRDALAASVKDRAENVMIVDLMRNDLGRVADTGSVSVERLFEIEAHPSVWQMVSTIRARLRAGLGAPELLRACWPPGSMTGAPKVRAMEIIESLEPVRRGPYAGAIGYFDASGAMDLSVVIRTAVVAAGRVMVQVGGAVVADSLPQAELDETYAKGRLLVQALAGGVSGTP